MPVGPALQSASPHSLLETPATVSARSSSRRPAHAPHADTVLNPKPGTIASWCCGDLVLEIQGSECVAGKLEVDRVAKIAGSRAPLQSGQPELRAKDQDDRIQNPFVSNLVYL